MKAAGLAALALAAMEVKVWGLPPNTTFDLFVTQVPNFPFGMSWYQGDIVTNKNGFGSAELIGQFNIETFVVAPGVLRLRPIPLMILVVLWTPLRILRLIRFRCII
jgi:hypothetical protein